MTLNVNQEAGAPDPSKKVVARWGGCSPPEEIWGILGKKESEKNTDL